MAATFKEVGRITVGDATDVVMSQVLESGELKGININKYITTDKYTGYAKGVYIPADNIEEFGVLVKKILAL